jgi:hypothetical protein
VRDIVFQAEEVAQAQGALRRRCSQDARLTGETMPARLRAHPRITGESRTCRSRPLAAGSLCGAAAPREVVIGGELRTPFSLSPQPIPTEGNVFTPNDHDPGVSTKSEVGKVFPQLKCARFRAERGSDSHDLAVRSVSSCDISH